jgi:hypothetical protein
MGRHDGPLHEDVPFPCERVGVLDSALGGKPFDIVANIRQVTDCRLVNGVILVVDFDHRGQECATLEVWPAKPLRKHVEDCQQPCPRRFTAALAFRLKPVPGPEPLTAAQKVEDQVVLGRKVPVKGHLRRAGPGDDGVYPDRPHAFAAEQLVRRAADPLAPAILPVVP